MRWYQHLAYFFGGAFLVMVSMEEPEGLMSALS
jgi:hypothetical protein